MLIAARSRLLMKDDSECVEDTGPDEDLVPPGLTEVLGVAVGANAGCRGAAQATDADMQLPRERRVAAGA